MPLHLSEKSEEKEKISKKYFPIKTFIRYYKKQVEYDFALNSCTLCKISLLFHNSKDDILEEYIIFL